MADVVVIPNPPQPTYSRAARVPMGRIHNNDPFHPRILPLVEAIREPRFFSRQNLEDSKDAILAEKSACIADFRLGRIDGFELKRIDEDCQRALKVAEGRLYQTAQRLQEIDAAKKRNGVTRTEHTLSNVDIMARIRASMPRTVEG